MPISSATGHHPWNPRPQVGLLLGLYVLVLSASLLPIWGVRFLPLVDLPQHMRIVHILHHYQSPHFNYQEYFELRPMVTTFLTYYYIADLLASVVTVETATRILLSFYVIGLPLSVSLARRAFGRSPWLGMLTAPLAFSFPFHMGFISYCLSLPLLFVSIAAWESTLRRPRPAWMLLAGMLGPGLFFTHALTYVVAVGVAVLLLLIHGWSRSASSTRAALMLVPGLIPFGIWSYRTLPEILRPDGTGIGGQAPNVLERLTYLPLQRKMAGLPGALTPNFPGHVDELLLVAWFLVYLGLLILSLLGRGEENGHNARGREQSVHLLQGDFVSSRPSGGLFHHRALTLSGALCALVFLVPEHVPGVPVVSTRLAIVGLISLALLPDLPRRRRSSMFVLGLVALLGCTQATFVFSRYRSFGEEVGPLRNLLTSLEDGRTVLGVIHDPTSEIIDKAPYKHFASYYSLEHGGATDNPLLRNPAIPIRLKNPAMRTPREWRPDRFRFDVDGIWYEFLLVRDTGSSVQTELQQYGDRLLLIRRAGDWAIYENVSARSVVREVRVDLRQQMARAEVAYKARSGGFWPCDRWDGKRWNCPLAADIWVGKTILPVGRKEAVCVFGPVLPGKSLMIRFPDVPIFDEIVGFVALDDIDLQHRRDRASVHVTVSAGGERVASLIVENVPGIQPFRLDTTSWYGRWLSLQFEVGSEGDGDRRFCFDARVASVTER